MKKVLSTLLVITLLLNYSGYAFASVSISSDTAKQTQYSISDAVITHLAKMNNMDPTLLKETMEAGPDAHGMSIFLLLSLAGLPYFNDHQEQQIFSPVIEDKQVTLTAKEALQLAYKEAAKIMDEPMLNRLQSTDDTEETQTIDSGADGKRIAWNVSFGNAQGTAVTDCQIRNGKCNIVHHDENKTGHLGKGDCFISDLRIDSPEVIEKAIQEKNLQPGNPAVEDDWIKGYHFTIYKTYFGQNEDQTIMAMRVTGISPDSPNEQGDSLRAEVYFDVQTGEMLGAAKQTGYDENGRSIWEDF